jgi:hypothetical protein
MSVSGSRHAPVEGGREGVLREGERSPNVSLAISAMPPRAPITLAASTGSIRIFWFGDVARLSSARI